MADTIRTEVTFRVWLAPADIELEYPGDVLLVLEPLPVEVEPLAVPLVVPVVLPVVPVAPDDVLAPLALGLLMDEDADAEAFSNVPVISTLWPTWPFSLSSSLTLRR